MGPWGMFVKELASRRAGGTPGSGRAPCTSRRCRQQPTDPLTLPCSFCLPACRREEVAEVYNTPLLDLVFSAARVHRMYNDPSMVRRRPPAAAGTPRVLEEAQGHWKLCRPALACWLAGRLSNMLFDCRRRLPNHCTELSTAHPHPYPLPCSLLPCPAPVPQVQRCTLLSIKTGGCPENCGYCSQSSHWSKETGTKAEKLLGLEEVYEVGGWVGGQRGWAALCASVAGVKDRREDMHLGLEEV